MEMGGYKKKVRRQDRYGSMRRKGGVFGEPLFLLHVITPLGLVFVCYEVELERKKLQSPAPCHQNQHAIPKSSLSEENDSTTQLHPSIRLFPTIRNATLLPPSLPHSRDTQADLLYPRQH